MAFTLPTFNLNVNIWRHGVPLGNPPSVTAMGNLAWGRRMAAPASGGTGSLGVVFTAPTLLLPALTDIRSDEKCLAGNDSVECPAGSHRFYICVYVEDIGKGFTNEHRAAILVPYPIAWPTPIP